MAPHANGRWGHLLGVALVLVPYVFLLSCFCIHRSCPVRAHPTKTEKKYKFSTSENSFFRFLGVARTGHLAGGAPASRPPAPPSSPRAARGL